MRSSASGGSTAAAQDSTAVMVEKGCAVRPTLSPLSHPPPLQERRDAGSVRAAVPGTCARDGTAGEEAALARRAPLPVVDLTNGPSTPFASQDFAKNRSLGFVRMAPGNSPSVPSAAAAVGSAPPPAASERGSAAAGATGRPYDLYAGEDRELQQIAGGDGTGAARGRPPSAPASAVTDTRAGATSGTSGTPHGSITVSRSSNSPANMTDSSAAVARSSNQSPHTRTSPYQLNSLSAQITDAGGSGALGGDNSGCGGIVNVVLRQRQNSPPQNGGNLAYGARTIVPLGTNASANFNGGAYGTAPVVSATAVLNAKGSPIAARLGSFRPNAGTARAQGSSGSSGPTDAATEPAVVRPWGGGDAVSVRSGCGLPAYQAQGLSYTPTLYAQPPDYPVAQQQQQQPQQMPSPYGVSVERENGARGEAGQRAGTAALAAAARSHVDPLAEQPRDGTSTPKASAELKDEDAVVSRGTMRRLCTEPERQLVLDEVARKEQHLHYPNIRIPAEHVNSGDTDVAQRRLEQRRKQITYGKDTDGYRAYTGAVPRVEMREWHNPLHPITPRPENDCSKRSFDKYLNAWRRQLHQWDHYDPDDVADAFRPMMVATLGELGLAGRLSPVPRPVSAVAPQHRHHYAGHPPTPVATLQSIANMAAIGSIESSGAASTPAAHRSLGARHSPVTGMMLSAGAAARHTPILRAGSGVRPSSASMDCRTPHLTFPLPCDSTPSSNSSVSLMVGYGASGTHNVGVDGVGSAAYGSRLVTAAASTPCRPQGPDGPEVDANFFACSRVGSPLGAAAAAAAAGGGHPSPLQATQLQQTAGSAPSRATPFGGCGRTPARAHRPGSPEHCTPNSPRGMQASAQVADGAASGRLAHMEQLLARDFDLMTDSTRASPARPHSGNSYYNSSTAGAMPWASGLSHSSPFCRGDSATHTAAFHARWPAGRPAPAAAGVHATPPHAAQPSSLARRGGTGMGETPPPVVHYAATGAQQKQQR